METTTVELTLSAGNQLTMPSLARKALKLQAGDKLLLQVDGKKAILEKAETQAENVQRVVAELAAWHDKLPTDVKDNIKKHAGWTINQYHDHYDTAPEHKTYLKEKYGINV